MMPSVAMIETIVHHTARRRHRAQHQQEGQHPFNFFFMFAHLAFLRSTVFTAKEHRSCQKNSHHFDPRRRAFMRRNGIAAAFCPSRCTLEIFMATSDELAWQQGFGNNWRAACSRIIHRGGQIMKPLQLIVLGSLIGGAFLTLATPSYARGFSHSPVAYSIRSDRSDIQQDRRELRDNRMDLNQDRQELRDDRRDGASRGEIGNDRTDVRQDRRDIVRDRQDLRGDRRDLRHDREEERHSFFDWWHSW
jgi:hypothetical protein